MLKEGLLLILLATSTSIFAGELNLAMTVDGYIAPLKYEENEIIPDLLVLSESSEDNNQSLETQVITFQEPSIIQYPISIQVSIPKECRKNSNLHIKDTSGNRVNSINIDPTTPVEIKFSMDKGTTGCDKASTMTQSY